MQQHIDHNYVFRLEAANHSLHKRNAELRSELEKLDPDNKFLSKPQGYTRASRLISLIDAAIAVANENSEMQELCDAIAIYDGYWKISEDTKIRRSESIKESWRKRSDK